MLPNDPDSVRAAQVAARTAEADGDVRVAVIPTQAQVQGLAALAVHEPGRAFDQDVLEMTATARHARHGAVTVAARSAMTMAGPCEPGDVLGAIEGDFVAVGDDLVTMATEVLSGCWAAAAIWSRWSEARTTTDWPARRRSGSTRRHPAVDVVVYDGGQERYPLLLSVE